MRQSPREEASMFGIVLVLELVLALKAPSILTPAARREAPVAARLPASPAVALGQQSTDHPRPAPGAAREPIPDIEKIFRRYADALRYFDKKLTDAEASQLAQSIINYSNAYGLDARLVV